MQNNGVKHLTLEKKVGYVHTRCIIKKTKTIKNKITLKAAQRFKVLITLMFIDFFQFFFFVLLTFFWNDWVKDDLAQPFDSEFITWLATVDRIFAAVEASEVLTQNTLSCTLTPSWRKGQCRVGRCLLTCADMSVKAKACNACQRNGRITCRRYQDRGYINVWLCSSDLSWLMMLRFQDQAGGALFEDVPSGVHWPVEEGEGGLQGWAHPDGELQAGSAGSHGADAGGTRLWLCRCSKKGSPQG